tara:strand:- start:158 stop:745 length:588 start_codon:yes stop_codon:yes gene_type:complete
MRTLTVKSGGGSSFSPGWHLVTINGANYGDFEGTQYIDTTFEEFPETFNMRIYAKHGNDGEEFAIGRLFRFANAGICEVSKSDDGESIVSIDDDAGQLIGKKVWIFMYKDGDYYRALNRVAPTEFENQLESFKDNDISYWKKNAEDYYIKFVKKNNTEESSSWGSEEEPNGEVKVGSWKDIENAVSEAQNDGIPS